MLLGFFVLARFFWAGSCLSLRDVGPVKDDNGPIRGQWKLRTSAPLPYPRNAINSTTSEFRVRGEACAWDNSWKYAWVPEKEPQRDLFTGQELCQKLPSNSSIFMFGDSLSGQLVTSWQTRLQYSQAGLQDCGKQFAMPPYNFQDPSKLGYGNAPWSCCPNGARIQYVEAWASAIFEKGVCHFESGSANENHKSCARSFCSNPRAFDVMPKTPIEFAGIFQSASVVIVNEFAHLHPFITKVFDCYNDRAAAKRDVLRFWKSQVVAKANALRDHTHARVLYRTSPPAGDNFLRWHPLTVPISAKSIREPSTDILSSAVDWWTNSTAKSKFKQVGRHLTRSEEVATDTSSERRHTISSQPAEENDHDIFAEINDMSKQAFLAAGHGILDVEEMLGTRQDAHPASRAPLLAKAVTSRHGSEADKLHYCMPGVPDYALDTVLERLF